MSASAFTATVAGWPGAGGIRDQTVEPRWTTGCYGSPAEAISIAARPADGGSGGFWASAWLVISAIARAQKRVLIEFMVSVLDGQRLFDGAANEFVGRHALGSRPPLDQPFHGGLDQQGNACSLAFGLRHGGHAHAHRPLEPTRLILRAKILL